MSTSQFAWAQVPVFGAVIVANMIVVRLVKDPTRPRFIWRAVPIQLSGLATLLLGNLLLPHVWLWSVLGTSLYAFGIGMIFPTLFRFTLFSNNLPKRYGFGLAEHGDSDGNGGVGRSWSLAVVSRRRLPFHLLAVVAGVIAVFTLATLLQRVRQHETAELAAEK
nr:sugar transport protein [Salmonella sp. NCTC 7297]